MATSRKKLESDARNVLLDRFLNDCEEDRADGKTIRGLHAALEKHTERDDKRFDDVQATLLELARPKSPKWIQRIFAKPLTLVLLAISTVAAHAIVHCQPDARAATSKFVP